ncbi:alpha/beta hydrolase [Caballeronia sp. LP006]|uniref:alpha/beta fold hydrolase n=1 Tax=Caballeronia sp. LP006 TaxID=3038552 RepID=UPI00285F48B9|nr:alpha/beta hydrolase [Caballeronia sp. LP006]MDR5827869.1 alpha/beta hydrolase [Caballeronia sp. LP006]
MRRSLCHFKLLKDHKPRHPCSIRRSDFDRAATGQTCRCKIKYVEAWVLDAAFLLFVRVCSCFSANEQRRSTGTNLAKALTWSADRGTNSALGPDHPEKLMLPYSRQGQGDVTFVLMHFLGGSHRTWFPTLPFLDHEHLCVALDTPGFGDAAHIEGYSVSEMADHIDATIRALQLERCVLVGHSMTGKIAVVLAARKPDYLAGLILVAPSPPGPQPMSEQDREQQRAYGKTRPEAEAFVDESSAHRLPDDVREVAIHDAQRVDLVAWRAWVDGGSKEDWSDRIGTLDYPALLVCGADDKQVPGPDEQRMTTLKHFPNGNVSVIDGAGHLMPLQTPRILAQEMLKFAKAL